MKIGIDIDGVLTNLDQFTYDYLSKYCFENNIDYKIGASDYDAYKTFNISSIQEDNFWNEYIDYYAKEITARPFASEVIKKLKQDGNEIYVITARWLTNRDDELGTNMRITVKNWLDKNNIYYDHLIFSKATNENKIQEIKENSIDIMIEDNPNNITELSTLIPVICYDTDYNKHCSGSNIIRCYSWYDIYNKIHYLKKD